MAKRLVDIMQDSLETGQAAHSVSWQTVKKTCRECSDQFNAMVLSMNGKVRHAQELCPACTIMEIEEERKTEALLKLPGAIAGVRSNWQIEANCPAKFREKTFDNFDKKLQPKAFKVLSTWESGRSVLLASDNLYGVGKTHLVCALLNKILAETTPAWISRDVYVQHRRCPVRFVTEPQLLDSIRATYREKATETDDLIYRQLAAFDVLILDDVGKTRPRDLAFLQGVYFRVIDERYANNKAVIVTTNLSLEELDAHIGGSCADRLVEMCGTQNIVEMKGKSYRGSKFTKGG